jgi:ABC-2 type transport system permease protein
MSPARTVLLVAGRETLDRLRNKAFVWGTGVTLVVLIAAIVIPTLFEDDGPRSYELGVVGAVPTGFAAALDQELAGQDAEAEVVELPDRRAASTAVEEGEVAAALLDTRQLMARDLPPATLHTSVDAALQQLALAEELERAGIDEQQLGAILGAHEPVTVIDPDGDAGEADTGFVLAFAATILLFVAIQFNGNSLLTGAIEEKSSRVVEVLLGAVRPWQLLTAKLLALTSLALGQIAIFVGGALGANAVVGAFDVPPATPRVVAISLLMVVIGFTFFAALYTVAGAMASSVEDAQGTAGPLAFLTVGTYMVVIFAVIPSPAGLLSQILTFLPPTAPFTVPARVAMGAIPPWQVATSALVTLAGTALTIRLAGRLYAAAVLAGGKLTWRAVWRAEPIR